MGEKKSKWLSRKFLMAVATAAFVVLQDGMGLNLPKETIMSVVGVVIAWICGESVIDAVRK